MDAFIGIINRIAQEHPILVDKYLVGKEIEVDAVCDGEDVLIPGIMEHIERAGIHSVRQLVEFSENDLLNIRNFGAKSIEEVKDKLISMDLNLKQ